MTLPLLTTTFYLRDIYGVDVPEDVSAKVELFRETGSEESLPDEYLVRDRVGYSTGEWSMVTVRVSIYNETRQVVGRAEVGGMEFGYLDGKFRNPIGNPDDFPVANLVRELLVEYRERGFMPL